MLYSKFIIESDALIMSKVQYHRELMSDREKVRGGGWFICEEDTKTFVLSGESHEFGRASFEDIINAIQQDRVFIGKEKLHSIASEYSFSYNTETEIVKIKNPHRLDGK